MAGRVFSYRLELQADSSPDSKPSHHRWKFDVNVARVLQKQPGHVVDLDATRARLEQAGLAHAAVQLPELVEAAAKDSISAYGFLDRLLSAELGEREERRIKTS